MNTGDIAGACMTLRIAESVLGKEVGISPQQLVFLDFVNDGDGKFTMGNLADYMNVTPAVCTGIADRLMRKGMLERIAPKPQGDDRRRTYIAATQAGRDALAKATAVLREVNTGG